MTRERSRETGEITSRPYGKVQAVRSKRKIFGDARQERFLEELAATCNVTWAAEAAGVTPQCVYQRRRRDGDFRDAWWAAVEEAYARLELRMLEEANGGEAGEGVGPPRPGPLPAGERESSDAPLDKELALHLLREHKKGLAGIRRGGTPELRGAQWAEVERYFMARLRALKMRLDSQGEAGTREERPLHRFGGPPSHAIVGRMSE